MFMKLPKGVTSAGYGGKEYQPDKTGIIEVPDDAVRELTRHGLVVVNAPAEEEPEKKVAAGANGVKSLSIDSMSKSKDLTPIKGKTKK